MHFEEKGSCDMELLDDTWHGLCFDGNNVQDTLLLEDTWVGFVMAGLGINAGEEPEPSFSEVQDLLSTKPMIFNPAQKG